MSYIFDKTWYSKKFWLSNENIYLSSNYHLLDQKFIVLLFRASKTKY